MLLVYTMNGSVVMAKIAGTESTTEQQVHELDQHQGQQQRRGPAHLRDVAGSFS